MNSLPPFSHLPAGRYRALGWLALSLATSAAAEADVIATFDEVAARTATPPVAYPAVTPEEKCTLSFVDLAAVHLAMYDAVVAPCWSAAAAAAACTVLQGLFPNRAPEPRARVVPHNSQGELS